MRSHKRSIPLSSVVLALGVLGTGQAHAGGFYVQEQSARQMGSAFAGSGADTSDASIVYSNPAGITQLQGRQFQANAHLVNVSAKLKNAGSTAATPATGGAFVPYNGQDSTNPYDPVVIPSVFATTPLSKDWSAGISVTTPFGIKNNYDPDFFGRYYAFETSLYTIDVQPTLAYKVSPKLSIGAGPNIQYAKARLKNAIPSPVTAGGPIPATDGVQDLAGDDVAYGYTAGILYMPDPTLRFGLSYRSEIHHQMDGRVIVRNPVDIGGAVSQSGASANVDLPGITNFSIAYDAAPNMTLLAQTQFFSWSNFEQLNVTTDNGGFEALPQHFKDRMNFSVGFDYGCSENLRLRMGYMYDPTPTESNFRGSSTPDGDRQWFTAGMRYAVADSLTLDASVARLSITDEAINLTRVFPTGATTMQGTTQGDATLVGVGMSYRF